MKINIHELSDQETHLEFSEVDPWVSKAVLAADETEEVSLTEAMERTGSGAVARSSSPVTAGPRPIGVKFELRKVDEVVVINGRISTDLKLVCSRCAQGFEMSTRPAFSGLFCKDPLMAGVGHLSEDQRPSGQNHGKARHAHDEEASSLMDQGKDLDITYLSNDYIDLAEVLTEFLTLQIPFQPLCKEDCKGMCAHCGADWNLGRCACAKLVRSTPFSVLQNIKV